MLSPFDRNESQLLEDLREHFRPSRQHLDVLEDHVDRLGQLATSLRRYPSLYEESRLGSERRSLDTLLEKLVAHGPMPTALDLPVKARLARDFVIAKLHAFRALEMALQDLAIGPNPDLIRRLRFESGQSTYTILAEELLLDIVMADEGVDSHVKRRAGLRLVKYWDDSISVKIIDICPALEAAWRSRNRLVLDFGTLVGSIEVVRLLTEADQDLVYLWFTEDTTREEEQAFEEFLFGLAIEDLDVLRREMERQSLSAVDRGWVAATLGISPNDLFSGVRRPETMYSSYRTRHVAGIHRKMRGLPGPTRAAETYLMIRVLEHQSDEESTTEDQGPGVGRESELRRPDRFRDS